MELFGGVYDQGEGLQPKGLSMSISSESLDISGLVPAVPLSGVSAEVVAEVARLGLGEQFPAVIALTRELFGDFTIDISEDPEIYNCVYVSFEVIIHGTVEDCVQRTAEWHRRLPRLPSQTPGSFCLVTRFAT
jgi:hypothetical protein